MLVAIVATGTGTVPVIVIAEGTDVANAISVWTSSYSPPLTPANYQGVDTGWPGPDAVAADPGKEWSVDRDAPALVQTWVDESAPNSDSAWQETVLSDSTTTPPGSPSDGDRYLVPVGGTGDWAGKENCCAEWSAQQGRWLYCVPTVGMFIYSTDNRALKSYDGADWRIYKSASMTWGANFTTAGSFAQFNGTETSVESRKLDTGTQGAASVTGTMSHLTWSTAAADGTTVWNILVNGIVVETITADAQKGISPALTTVVNAGTDLISVQYDSGTAPGHGTYSLEITAS